MKIEVGKVYKLPSYPKGRAIVLAYDEGFYFGFYAPREGSEKVPMMWDENGRAFDHTRNWNGDLGEEWKEPRSGVSYVNVYPDDFEETVYQTRELADKFCGDSRLACIRVPWTEGQFDD